MLDSLLAVLGEELEEGKAAKGLDGFVTSITGRLSFVADVAGLPGLKEGVASSDCEHVTGFIRKACVDRGECVTLPFFY